jgi:FHA domain-containing protein
MQNAELIFVAGPEQGQRSALMSDSAVLGRSPACDVQAAEPTVSRRQAKFTLLAEGWVVEDLSRTPLRINGRRYKPGKQVLLETGDVLELGALTRILYVAPGDDAEQALLAWREANPLVEAVEGAPRSEASESPAVPPERKGSNDAPQGEKAAIPPDTGTRKRRRYIIASVAFVVYAAGVFLIIGAIAGRRGDGKPDNGASASPLAKLTDSEIDRSIRAPLTAPKYVSEAGAALQKALQHHRTSLDRPGDLYRSVKFFKLHLAYKGGGVFSDPNHERLFMTAQDDLVAEVQNAYRDAWVYEQRHDWREALRGYEKIQQMLPVMEEPHPDRENKVFQNVLKHVSFVRKNLGKRR